MSHGRARDVVIVGGGAIGCAIARQAALSGLAVTVVERGAPGGEASSAAAGMLSPLAEASGPGPFVDLLLQSRALYPAFADELRGEAGADVGYSAAGTLYLSLGEGDDAELDARHAWQHAAGLGVERLTAAEAREMEPALSPGVRFALRFPGDHQVDAAALTAALHAAARRAGADFRVGVEAAGLLLDGDRALGIGLADGGRIDAGAVVLAGGAWAGSLAGLPRPLPVEPVYGQLVSWRTAPPLFRHVVDSPRVYLVPRADGRVIAGATVERIGYERAVTTDATRRLSAAAAEIAPALAASPVDKEWCGLRPGTPDGLPILGRDPEVANLIYAAGHYRNGILLTPLTADIVTELLLGEIPLTDLAPYRIDRF